jgi:hypothetical protein
VALYLSYLLNPPSGTYNVEVTMSALYDLLAGMTDKPVVDMTGLSGNYQLALDVSPEEMFGGMARSQGITFGPVGPGGPGGRGGPVQSGWRVRTLRRYGFRRCRKAGPQAGCA